MKLLFENLPKKINEHDLSRLLAGFDGFNMAVVTNGLGYAEFDTRVQGRNIILRFSGTKLLGKSIRVTQTRLIPSS